MGGIGEALLLTPVSSLSGWWRNQDKLRKKRLTLRPAAKRKWPGLRQLLLKEGLHTAVFARERSLGLLGRYYLTAFIDQAPGLL